MPAQDQRDPFYRVQLEIDTAWARWTRAYERYLFDEYIMPVVSSIAIGMVSATNAKVKIMPEQSDLLADYVENELANPNLARERVLAAATMPEPAPSTGVDLAHVHQLLIDAKERLAVNALGDVATFLDRAIQLLEG